ncbi:hypothetical protein [Campylobacter iguaniorum]|uniref:hypothetical protein n=1 Tax=Campylobacter iguaniorum TaxID=1244531 RepID=UPI0019125CD4|nr:hypothetical protein [Campylobacter iguaniorum]
MKLRTLFVTSCIGGGALLAPSGTSGVLKGRSPSSQTATCCHAKLKNIGKIDMDFGNIKPKLDRYKLGMGLAKAGLMS